ncbi:MAG: hypothetical protein FJX25_05925 [Alphaproteobacteria bacterium]|nr:hypothetical protein [Alphaproteobacteria bacterium]
MNVPVALSLALLLTACGKPDDFPRLLPTAQILAEPALPVHATVAATEPDAVEAAENRRAEALRARARELQGPVVDPVLRRRAEG